jgi:hypothetical protein
VDSIFDGAPPRVEYEEHIHQWTIENHFASDDGSSSNIVLIIQVFDSNQNVSIRNCHGVSVDIHGKTMKSVTIEDSSDSNVVFDSVSDACNIVHSKTSRLRQQESAVILQWIKPKASTFGCVEKGETYQKSRLANVPK